MADETAIEIRGLTKQYKGGVRANDAIDLSIAKGSVFSLLGPNGAGKTTLVRQITGELTPTSGEIRVLGVDALKDPLAAKALMGVVPQEANPYLHLNAREHLVLFGQLHGLDSRRAASRSEELLASLDLAQHARKQAQYLSGGLKRKLLVGMALMAEPPLLVLDEPTTGLDPHSRREVWALLRSMRANGTTVLITTHYMDEAEALSDHVAVIGGGRILARGNIEEIRRLCRNQYKAVFENGAAERETVYGSSQRDVVAILERLGVVEYSLMRTNLEDLYMELTGKELEEAALA